MDDIKYEDIEKFAYDDILISGFDMYYFGFFSYYDQENSLEESFDKFKGITDLLGDPALLEMKIEAFADTLVTKINPQICGAKSNEGMDIEKIRNYLIQYFGKLKEFIMKLQHLSKPELFFVGRFHAIYPSFKIDDTLKHFDKLNQMTSSVSDDATKVDRVLKILKSKAPKSQDEGNKLYIPSQGSAQKQAVPKIKSEYVKEEFVPKTTQVPIETNEEVPQQQLTIVQQNILLGELVKILIQQNMNEPVAPQVNLNLEPQFQADENKTVPTNAKMNIGIKSEHDLMESNSASTRPTRTQGPQQIERGTDRDQSFGNQRPQVKQESGREDSDQNINQENEESHNNSSDNESSENEEDKSQEDRDIGEESLSYKSDNDNHGEKPDGDLTANIIEPERLVMNNQERHLMNEPDAFDSDQILGIKREEVKQVQTQTNLQQSEKKTFKKCVLCERQLTPDLAKSFDTCEDYFHEKCIKDYLKEQIGRKRVTIKCPSLSCEIVIRLIDMIEFVEQPELDEYIPLCLNEYTDSKHEVCCCPTPGCSYFFLRREKEFECPVCDKKYCLNCQADWHQNMDCIQFKERQKKPREEDIGEDRSGNKFKKCLSCGTWVPRILKMNKLICKCKNKFCYVCGKQNPDSPCRCLNNQKIPKVSEDLFHKIMQTPVYYRRELSQLKSGRVDNPQNGNIRIEPNNLIIPKQEGNKTHTDCYKGDSDFSYTENDNLSFRSDELSYYSD